jgi:hypothetical protein
MARIYDTKQAWKQFSSAAGVPSIYVTDSEIQAEGRCISDRLEKIDGKRRPQPRKFVSKAGEYSINPGGCGG